MNVLLNRCHRRAHLAEELVEEAWLQEHRGAMQAYAAEETICECLDVAELLRHGWQTVLDRLFSEDIKDLDGYHSIILAAVERTIGTVKRAHSMARRAVEQNFAVEGFSELVKAIPALEQLRLEIENKWPGVDPQMVAESLAAYGRGEYQLSEELLCEAQGGSSKADQ